MDFEGKEIKPDANIYDRKEYNQSQNEAQEPKLSQLMVEFKVKDADDPFDDQCPSHSSFERVTQKAQETLGQITLYATAHLAAQFRTHVFSALVFPKCIRFLRWDRSGVVVTERLSWSSPTVHSFFRRFNYASPAVRGIDTTIGLEPSLSPVDDELIRDKLGCKLKGQIISIKVNDDDIYYALNEKYYARLASPNGRATRAFKAYDLKNKRIVFVKDTWRIVDRGLRVEHKTYEKLHMKKVPYIPVYYTSGDIDGQRTLSDVAPLRPPVEKKTASTKKKNTAQKQTQSLDDSTPDPKAGPRMRRTFRVLQHYRLVLEYLEGSLESVKTTKEMVSILRDIAEGHYP